MIAELGHVLLLLCFAAALLAAAGAADARRAAVAAFAAAALSMAALVACFALSDFSVVNVVANSHSLKPMLYKISAAWGSHEGSMLLWVTVLAGWTLAFARDAGKAALRVQAGLLAVFALFTLLASNPFLRGLPAGEGDDLNPLLQDPLLALHPPFLYLGYVGFSVCLSAAAGALLSGRVDAGFAAWLRPYAAYAFAFLTVGIALGSFWAYYELGWGGFWFWDPVENASLLPWLAGAALLHALSTLERRGALSGWVIFLCMLCFILSLLGTFLVRSGLLTSVHAFASDPLRGTVILVLLTVIAGAALLLYALRAPRLPPAAPVRAASREGAMLVNNVFLFAAVATVATGTLYPVIMNALGGAVAVGAPYYVATLVPMLLPFAILMAAAPLMPWGRADIAALLPRLAPLLAAALLLALMAGTKTLALVGLFSGLVIMLAAGRDVIRLRARLPRRQWAMVLSHAGFGLVILGATVATQFGIEKTLWMQPGDSVKIARHAVTYLGTEAALGVNYNAERGGFLVAGEILSPERRWYPAAATETSETALLHDRLGILYVVIGEAGDDGRRVVRLYHHPLLLLVFAGALLIAAGAVAGIERRRA